LESEVKKGWGRIEGGIVFSKYIILSIGLGGRLKHTHILKEMRGESVSEEGQSRGVSLPGRGYMGEKVGV